MFWDIVRLFLGRSYVVLVVVFVWAVIFDGVLRDRLFFRYGFGGYVFCIYLLFFCKSRFWECY